MHEELRHFLLIVEEGTFTRAARRAHLSQPALSASIRRLEDRVGARLLDRGRHGAEATAAGRAFLPSARQTVAAFEDGIRAVAEIEGLGQGEVRVGAGATAATFLLPKILSGFRKKHPNLRYLLREGYAQEIRQQVEQGELDIGIITGEGDEPWYRDELVIVASSKIDPCNAGFVTFPEGSATRALMHEKLGEVPIVMELAGIGAVKGNVRAGMGKALMSRAAVKAELASGRFVEIPHPKTPIRRTLSLVHRGLSRMPPAAAALREDLLARRR